MIEPFQQQILQNQMTSQNIGAHQRMQQTLFQTIAHSQQRNTNQGSFTGSPISPIMIESQPQQNMQTIDKSQHHRYHSMNYNDLQL